jgi:hypothetical protein
MTAARPGRPRPFSAWVNVRSGIARPPTAILSARGDYPRSIRLPTSEDGCNGRAAAHSNWMKVYPATPEQVIIGLRDRPTATRRIGNIEISSLRYIYITIPTLPPWALISIPAPAHLTHVSNQLEYQTASTDSSFAFRFDDFKDADAGVRDAPHDTRLYTPTAHTVSSRRRRQCRHLQSSVALTDPPLATFVPSCMGRRAFLLRPAPRCYPSIRLVWAVPTLVAMGTRALRIRRRELYR